MFYNIHDMLNLLHDNRNFKMIKKSYFQSHEFNFLLNFSNTKLFKQNYIKIKKLSLELIAKVLLYLKY